MEYLLTIPGRMIGLNDYIAAERTSKYKAAKLKHENEGIVIIAIRNQLKGVKIKKPVFMEYLWAEPNKRRDMDNIIFSRKFIQDALVKSGVLRNDGWKEIVGFSDRFEVDKNNPRIEVLIKEVK